MKNHSRNLPQIVTHILQKAFFKHALVQKGRYMYSILIVDDEPIVKIALRSILPWEEHGFSICGTASNGLEALPLIEQHHPDVIITDLKMPWMDGLELIRTLK